uniref:Mpv17-like protein 2 n=1 Tax=Parascaris univalens TaxID=6257 RepID=A0A915C693_PARUN
MYNILALWMFRNNNGRRHESSIVAFGHRRRHLISGCYRLHAECFMSQRCSWSTIVFSRISNTTKRMVHQRCCKMLSIFDNLVRFAHNSRLLLTASSIVVEYFL